MRKSPRHRISDREPAITGRHRSSAVVRHRRPLDLVRLPTRERLRRVARNRTGLALGVLASLALATFAGQSGGPGPTTALGSAPTATTTDVVGVLRSFDRGPAPTGSPDEPSLDAATQVPQSEEERAAAEAAAAQAAWLAANPTPVAGLDQIQMNNALKIVQAGQAMGLPKRAFVIAVATSLQESGLRNLASTRIPESYNYNAEGDGSDHDSVGLFQQRASTGWGAVWQLMDPTYAATAFYSALLRVTGWEGLPLTVAAQRVQVSAYPDHYAQHEARAQQIVDALAP